MISDKWRELECTGSRPPPLERFSFDKIDQDRALLFGGKRGLFSAGLNSFYILDLDIMVRRILSSRVKDSTELDQAQ